MKRTLIILFFAISTITANSQVVFNKIIEDTVAHITSSVIALDTGYVFLTGTRNEYWNRSFALTYVDINGNKQWKRIFGDTEVDFWEGLRNSLKVDNHISFSVSSAHYSGTGLCNISIYIYDNFYNLLSTTTIISDTIWKNAFNIIRGIDNCFYITGQIDDPELDDAFLLLIKTDSLGNFLWKKSYGQRYEYGSQLIETSDNNILIGGGTFSFPTTITDEDWYLLKLDTAGTVIWERGFGNPNLYDGSVKGLIETQDSNYIACGIYPAFEAAGNSYCDGCLRKVDKDGELMWTKYYRNYSHNPTTTSQYTDFHINSIVQLPNGNFGIVGSCYWYYTILRGFLMQTDSQGRIKWYKYYFAEDYTSSWQYLQTLKPTNDGGFILAGYGNEYDEFGYDPPQQAWLVKTDSLGLDGLCNVEIPELNIDIEFPATVCTNDTIEVYAYIAGKSAPYTIEFSTGQVIDSIYYPPLFVPIEIGLTETSIEVGGIEYYSEQITEATLSNHEWGQCIAKPVEFHTPTYTGNIPIDITVTDAYGESKTITKLVSVIECDDNINTENVSSVKLYPNPARDKVYVDMPVTSASLSHLESNAEIYNSVGQLVKPINLHKGLNVVDVSGFEPGNYIIKVDVFEKSYNLNFEKL